MTRVDILNIVSSVRPRAELGDLQNNAPASLGRATLEACCRPRKSWTLRCKLPDKERELLVDEIAASLHSGFASQDIEQAAGVRPMTLTSTGFRRVVLMVIFGAVASRGPRAIAQMRPLTIREQAIPVVPDDKEMPAELQGVCRPLGVEHFRTVNEEDMRRRASELQAEVAQVLGTTSSSHLAMSMQGRLVPWFGGSVSYMRNEDGSVNRASLRSAGVPLVQVTDITGRDVQFWQCPNLRKEVAKGDLIYRVHREVQLFHGMRPPQQCDQQKGLATCELQVFRDDQMVSRGDGGFAGLSSAVAAHLPAVDHAKRAEALAQNALHDTYLGTGFAFGFLAATAVGVAGYFKHNTPLMVGGVSGMAVSLLFVWFFGSGAKESMLQANTEAMNAVDLYDDRHVGTKETR